MTKNYSLRDSWRNYLAVHKCASAPELLDYTENVCGLSINSATRKGKLASVHKSLDNMVKSGELRKNGGIYYK